MQFLCTVHLKKVIIYLFNLLQYTLYQEQVKAFKLNAFAASIQIYHTSKPALNQAVFTCLTNGVTPWPIAPESCSNP